MRDAGGARILIVRVGAMGDVLHALPAVAMLREEMPRAFVGWAIEPRWASLLCADSATPSILAGSASPSILAGSASMPLVDRVHAVEARAWSNNPFSFATVRSVLALRRDLRQQRYAIAIDLQGSIRSAFIARLSGAEIIGSAVPREWPARLFYSRRIRTMAPHVIEQAAEIVAGALGMLAPEAPQQIRSSNIAFYQRAASLPRDNAADRWCDTLLQGQALPAVLLAPTAGWGAKQWPAERYGAVAAELASRGYLVLVNATPPLPDATADFVVSAAQAALAEPSLASRVRPVVSTLPQLNALLRRCALVLAGDTGPLHLAAALGRPVVAIFGPTDPARNGPFGTLSRVLRDPGSVTSHRRTAKPEAGLLGISSDAVLVAALALLRADGNARPVITG